MNKVSKLILPEIIGDDELRAKKCAAEFDAVVTPILKKYDCVLEAIQPPPVVTIRPLPRGGPNNGGS